jgi:hypothetical protein
MSLLQLVWDRQPVQLLFEPRHLTKVMKFRPKRSRSLGTQYPLNTDPIEPSDNELEETETQVPQPILHHPPTPPPTPSRNGKSRGTGPRDVLRIFLHHGDILIQCGAGLQKRYEVFYFGLIGLRAACCCACRISSGCYGEVY